MHFKPSQLLGFVLSIPIITVASELLLTNLVLYYQTYTAIDWCKELIINTIITHF